MTGLNGLDDSPNGRPVFQAEQASYTLDPSQKQLDVVLKTTTAEGLEVSKTYHFVRGDYRVKVSYDIKNNSAQPWSGVLFGQLLIPRTSGRVSTGDPVRGSG